MVKETLPRDASVAIEIPFSVMDENAPGSIDVKPGQLASKEIDALLRRLSRVEGQIRGVKKMLTEGRECRDVVTQFAAVTRALDQAALNFLTSQLVLCLEHPEEAKQAGYSLEELKRLLTKLH